MVTARDRVLETSIRIDIDPKGKVTKGHNIRVGDQGPYVILFIDQKPIPMRTIQAVQVYLELGRRAEEITKMQCAGEIGLETGVVLLTIGRDRVAVWPEFARIIAGALMRHADTVDDWQIANSQRM